MHAADRLLDASQRLADLQAALDQAADALAAAAAADRLLQDLRHAGCHLRLHADFDGGGIRIGNVVHQRFRCHPLADGMGVRDYEQASGTSVVTTRIRSPVPDARWHSKRAPIVRELMLHLKFA